VHGRCIGGGVGIAAAADYAIACEGADIKLSELSLGIGTICNRPVVKERSVLVLFQAWQLIQRCGGMRNGQNVRDSKLNCILLLKIWMNPLRDFAIVFLIQVRMRWQN
jgi:hypothetical protein